MMLMMIKVRVSWWWWWLRWLNSHNRTLIWAHEHELWPIILIWVKSTRIISTRKWTMQIGCYLPSTQNLQCKFCLVRQGNCSKWLANMSSHHHSQGIKFLNEQQQVDRKFALMIDLRANYGWFNANHAMQNAHAIDCMSILQTDRSRLESLKAPEVARKRLYG